MSEFREAPIEINGDDFKRVGYKLIDSIADFFDTIGHRPVTPGANPKELQKILGASAAPEKGAPPSELINRATDLLFGHSLLNGHPKFFGYITSSSSPIGALADL